MPSSLQYPSAYSRSKFGWFSAAAAAQTSPCFSAPGKSAGMNLIAAFRGFGCATSVRNTALWSVLPTTRCEPVLLGNPLAFILAPCFAVVHAAPRLGTVFVPAAGACPAFRGPASAGFLARYL